MFTLSVSSGIPSLLFWRSAVATLEGKDEEEEKEMPMKNSVASSEIGWNG